MHVKLLAFQYVLVFKSLVLGEFENTHQIPTPQLLGFRNKRA